MDILTYDYLEIWKDVEGFRNIYSVSTYGRVASFRFGYMKIMAPLYRQGYQYILLQSSNGQFEPWAIHRLVGVYFIPISQDLLDQGYTYDTLYINHKDEDKANNCVWNLEWCTPKYNSNYGSGKDKISQALSMPISQFDYNGNWIANYSSRSDAEEKTGISHAAMGRVAAGTQRLAGDCIWKNTLPEYGPGYQLQLENTDYQFHTRKVRMIDKYSGVVLRIFDTMTEAAKCIGVDSTAIRQAIKKGYCSGGYKWDYAD